MWWLSSVKNGTMDGPVAFGRYVLLEQLALGGMAEIFLAKAVGEAGFEKAFVIKRVLPHLTLAHGFVEMFLDEARIAAQLNHPGIVQIFDLGKQDGDYYFAMEYLAGEDVAAIAHRCEVQGRQIPVDVAVKVASTVAEALHYAHGYHTPDGRHLGIVHRDISPSNLFITYHGTVKVLDFGIARAEQRLQQTRAGHIKGKAAYMAPEQARGEQVDARADVWSLGVCLHEMLTGRRLFLRDSSGETLLAVREGPIPRPCELRPEIPLELDALIMQALERDVNRRFPSADVLRSGLDRYLADRTYVPQTVQLGHFLKDLFGEERAQAQLRRASVASGRNAAEGTQVLAGEKSTARREPTVAARPARLTPLQSKKVELPPSAPPLPEEPPTAATVEQEVPDRRKLLPFSAAAGIFVLIVAAGASLWVSTPEPPSLPVVAGAEPGRAPEQQAPEPEKTPESPQRVVPMELAETTAPTGPAVPAQTADQAPQASPAEPGPEQKTRKADSKRAVASATRLRERRKQAQPTRAPVAPARLSLRANAPVTAFIGERNLGALPVEDVELPPGSHTVRLTNPELGLSRTTHVRLESGKAAQRVVTFRKGKLNVSVQPWADVYVDGVLVGQTPLAARELWEGWHKVRLVNPSGEKTVTVKIEPGETRVVKEQLP